MERRKLGSVLKSMGVASRVRVRNHSPAKLHRLASLEGVLEPLQHDEIVYDPTGCVVRGGLLTQFSEELRARSDKPITGVYWNSHLRGIFVVLDKEEYFSDEMVKVADLGSIERNILDSMGAKLGELGDSVVRFVRVGFGFPGIDLVPVDMASVVSHDRTVNGLRTGAVATTAAAFLGLGIANYTTQASAADLDAQDPYCANPAVSAPNGKIAGEGGIVNEDDPGSEGVGFATGSFTLPLGCQFGFQADGMLGFRDDDFLIGAGAHLFWRDPEVGLLGVVGAYTDINRESGFLDQDVAFLGAEGELYLDQFTFSALGGYLFGENIDDGILARLDLRWYVTDDLMLTGGGSYSEEREGKANIGIEFQPGYDAFPGLSVFATGEFAGDDYAMGLVGLRYYFGGRKSLKDRHRRDDPLYNASKDSASEAKKTKKKEPDRGTVTPM